MNLKYQDHPAFPSGFFPWNLSSELLNNFSDIYLFSRNHSRTLTKAVNNRIIYECNSAFANIFDSLRKQADTERKKLFLEELEKYANILLNEDLNFFCWRNNYRFSKTTPSTGSLKKAYLLSKRKYYTGQLDSQLIQEILRISTLTLDNFREVARQGRTSREALSLNSGSVVGQIAQLLNVEFDRNGVNQSVSLYMGQEMQIGGLALELSVPQATWWKNAYCELTHDPKTLYFHIDESPAYPKAIIYLTDVSEISGPTSVAENILEKISLNPLQLLIGRIICKVGRSDESPLMQEYKHSYHQVFACPTFREDFMHLPQEIRWNSHLGWDVIPGSSLEELLVKHELKILGEPGKFVVFDGASLLHRGGMVKSGERIALQVVFVPVVPKSYSRRVLSKIRGAGKKIIATMSR